MMSGPGARRHDHATATANMPTTNMPDNSPAGAATPLAAELASINQPHLIARQSRVQFFREMFALPLAVPGHAVGCGPEWRR